jgi:hypothetical protein
MPQHQEPSAGEWSHVAALSSDLATLRYITADGSIIGSVSLRRDITQDVAFANAHMMAAAKLSHDANVELAAIVRELCATFKVPLPQASLDRSDAAAGKATGLKRPAENGVGRGR